MSSALRLASILKKQHPDIIHIHHFKDAFTAIYAKLLSGQKDIKIILTRHLVKKGKKNPLYNWLYRHINQFIFVSRLAKNEFLSTNPEVPEEKIAVIYNSILPLPEMVESCDLAKRYTIEKGTLLLGFTGRIHPEKGLEVLFRSLNEIAERKFRLFIIGTGDFAYIEKLQLLAEEYGIKDKVYFCGYIHPVSPIISRIDIGILPTIVPESFGLSAIEYMQAGKPVITTNNGAQTEFITNGENGLLIPPGDSEALAKALKKLVDDPALRKRLGEKAKGSVEQKFSYDTFYKQIMEIYER